MARLADYGSCEHCLYPMRSRYDPEAAPPGTRRRAGPGLCTTCQDVARKRRKAEELAYQEWHDPDPTTADGRALIYWLNNHRKATA